LIERPVDGDLSAGEHVAAAAAHLAPGIYLVCLEAAGRVRVQKWVRLN
jgi:hypothetical protein